MDCCLPGSSSHGILQARIPEWVAISFARWSSQPRDQIQVSCVAGGLLHHQIHQGRTQATILAIFTVQLAQLVKNPPAMQETLARSLGWEDALEKGKATHSSVLAWRIPWTVSSMGSQSRTWVSDSHFRQCGYIHTAMQGISGTCSPRKTESLPSNQQPPSLSARLH